MHFKILVIVDIDRNRCKVFEIDQILIMGVFYSIEIKVTKVSQLIKWGQLEDRIVCTFLTGRVKVVISRSYYPDHLIYIYKRNVFHRQLNHR